MRSKRPPTIRDQILNILREGIRTRRWAGVLPGVRPLAKELGVSIGTLQAALRRLEEEGFLVGGEAGVPRSVADTVVTSSPRSLRIGIMLHESVGDEGALNQVLLYGIVHALEQAGHRAFFAPKVMRALRHDPKAIRETMSESAADAWVVDIADRAVLETLAKDFPTPVLALGGPAAGLEIAAVRMDDVPLLRESVRRLLALGHERIVMAFPPRYRKPVPGPGVRAFREELEAGGIRPGKYHVPEWEHTAEGFNDLLASLFALTPPTALILHDARQVCAVYAFLAARRIHPKNLALVILDSDPAFNWMSPRPVYAAYDNDAFIRVVFDWVSALAEGRRDTSQVILHGRVFLDGLAPPPKS